MTMTVSTKFTRGGGVLAAMIAAVLLAFGTPQTVQAQDGLGRVIGGAAVGAIIGGAVKGGKGAAVGAGIGAAVGAASAARSRQHHAPAPGPAPVHRDNLVYNTQVSLTRLGYDAGPIDGVYGQRTADAISAYEYNNNLPVTGQPDPGLLQHMQSQGG